MVNKVADKILLSFKYQKELSRNTQMSSKYPAIIEKANKTSDFTIRLAFLWYNLNDLFQFDYASLYYFSFLIIWFNFLFYLDSTEKKSISIRSSIL